MYNTEINTYTEKIGKFYTDAEIFTFLQFLKCWQFL